MRQRRALLGMSQTALANAVGLTFQQIQKYECGTNRMGASRLYEFAKALDIAVPFFFEEMPPAIGGEKRKPGRQRIESDDSDVSTKRETLELVRAYYKIRRPQVRGHIRSLVQTLAAPK